MAQLPKEMGGAEGKVAWIGRLNREAPTGPGGPDWREKDTEGTFRPERICQIAERFGGTPESLSPLWNIADMGEVDPDQACENISCQRALNSEVSMLNLIPNSNSPFSSINPSYWTPYTLN